MKNGGLSRGWTVSVIPATRTTSEHSGGFSMEQSLRVAAYCRVSTGDESQQSSYGKQKSFYTKLILENPDWTLAGIYADEAISGTSRARRRAFNQMMQDALAGKMDYIITKSISRFARNTVDTLHCVRQLRQLPSPVGIFFEKENIDTLDAKGELILTILSALAQEESRSISENIRWAFQKNFRSGKPHVNLNRMLGYDWDEQGNWVVNPHQAAIVRFIFRRFLEGDSGRSIARQLNDLGLPTVQGNAWRSQGVYTVLRNEKYVGDLEMQKTVTVDFLNHRCAVNHGEAPKYYVKDHHPAIVSRLDWEKVQSMLQKPKESALQPPIKHRRSSVFFVLRCGDCGRPLVRMFYSGKHPLDGTQLRYPVWRCVKKQQDGITHLCCTASYHEAALKQSFMECVYRYRDDYEQMGEEAFWIQEVRQWQQQEEERRIQELFDTPEYQKQQRRLQELEESLRQMDSCAALSSEEEQAIYRDLKVEMEQELRHFKAAMEESLKRDGKTKEQARKLSFFISCLQQLPPNPASALDACSQHSLLLPFDHGFFSSFVVAGKVKGDTIIYQTDFGLVLPTTGNLRSYREFIK